MKIPITDCDPDKGIWLRSRSEKGSVGYDLMGFRRLNSRADVRFRQPGDLGHRNAVELVRAWGGRLIPPHGSWTGFSQFLYGDALYVRRVADYLQKAASGRTDALLLRRRRPVLAFRSRPLNYLDSSQLESYGPQLDDL